MSVAILGNGYGALHLALRLQIDGRDPHLFGDRTSEQLLTGRQSIGVPMGDGAPVGCSSGGRFWQEPSYAVKTIRVYLGLPDPIRFETQLSKPGYMIDHRVYQSRLLDEFTARGGKVTYGALEQRDLGKLTESHEATVVATGKGGLQDLFDHVEEHCPYSVPQRLLCSGLYEGLNFRR